MWLIKTNVLFNFFFQQGLGEVGRRSHCVAVEEIDGWKGEERKNEEGSWESYFEDGGLNSIVYIVLRKKY